MLKISSLELLLKTLRSRLEYSWQRFQHPLTPHAALHLINSKQPYQAFSYKEILNMSCEFSEKSDTNKFSDALDDKFRYFSFDPRCFIPVELARSHGREYEIQIIGYHISSFCVPDVNFITITDVPTDKLQSILDVLILDYQITESIDRQY